MTYYCIRENGKNKCIPIIKERDEMSLDVRLRIKTQKSEVNVYRDNITHNLGKMAVQAGVYEVLWRPDEHGYETAEQIIPILKAGLALLQSDSVALKAFNPENGWGDYDGLVEFVADYLAACEEFPEATIYVSR